MVIDKKSNFKDQNESTLSSLSVIIINVLLQIAIDYLTSKEFYNEISDYYSTYVKYLSLSQFINTAVSLTITYKFLAKDHLTFVC